MRTYLNYNYMKQFNDNLVLLFILSRFDIKIKCFGKCSCLHFLILIPSNKLVTLMFLSQFVGNEQSIAFKTNQ